MSTGHLPTHTTLFCDVKVLGNLEGPFSVFYSGYVGGWRVENTA